jgi:hypothetical protein
MAVNLCMTLRGLLIGHAERATNVNVYVEIVLDTQRVLGMFLSVF